MEPPLNPLPNFIYLKVFKSSLRGGLEGMGLLLFFYIFREECLWVVVELYEVLFRHMSRIGGIKVIFLFASIAPY